MNKVTVILLSLMFVSCFLLFLNGCSEKESYSSLPNTARDEEARNPVSDFYYTNELTRWEGKIILFNDYPGFVQPLKQEHVFYGPMLVNDPDADLIVQSFRYSYNARGIVIVQNALDGEKTAIITVHPWGVDDEMNYNSPEPAGVALFCTPEKNRIYLDHLSNVLNPFIESMKDHVKFTGYSLPGHEDEIRKHMYKSIDHDQIDKSKGQDKFDELLKAKKLNGRDIKTNFILPGNRKTLTGYFKAFPGLDSSPYFNGSFWDVPMPLASELNLGENDFVIYDADGYEKLRDYLLSEGIQNILLCGYATDMCVVSTTAGYMNLSQDFNVFIVGDATLATFPAQDTPAYATSAALSLASLNQFVTQISWISGLEDK